MRAKGAAVLASTTLACVIVVSMVHDQQVTERDALHQGVIRDKELYKRKLHERAQPRGSLQEIQGKNEPKQTSSTVDRGQ